MDDVKKVADTYNQFGDYYHQSRTQTSGRLHNELIDMPATLSLLPDDLSGVNILDAGCGSGIYSVLLAKKKARVTGIDASSKMIEIARKEKPAGLVITYQVGNLYTLDFEKETFDIVLCAYVLENVKDIYKVFEQFSRVLKSSGFCIFSVSHPFRANSVRTKKNGKEIWVMEDYFSSAVRQSDFGHGMIVEKYKRTIQQYADTISATGFIIERILEPQPIEEGKRVDSKGYEKAMRLPQILTMKLKKYS